MPDLRATIRRAIKTGKPARTERAKVMLRGKNYEINIQVVPFKIAGTDKPSLLVIFDESTRGNKRETLLRVLGKTTAQREVTDLRQELVASKNSLQTIIEEQEATNEELKAANEEIESSNEELQSTNEEFETAKEELQSTNEELTTLNEELSNRNLEMMQMTNELNNLLASIQMPIVMVDNALTVRRATPAAREAFNILPTDIGRRLSQLRPNIDVPDLENILRDVIDTLSTRECKVTDKEGRDYSLRVRPYRTTDNKIDGAVITLVDIDGTKKGDTSKNENRSKNARRENKKRQAKRIRQRRIAAVPENLSRLECRLKCLKKPSRRSVKTVHRFVPCARRRCAIQRLSWKPPFSDLSIFTTLRRSLMSASTVAAELRKPILPPPNCWVHRGIC